MKTITITTRQQWAKYLEGEARKMAACRCELEELRELVAEAYALRERMPFKWAARAAKALARADQ